MDHKVFLSSLNSDQRDSLLKLSNEKGLLHLAGHWGSICVCAALVLSGVLFWQIILLVLGILLVFLFTLLHECSHKTPFKTGWINELVGHVSGFAIFLPAFWFRFFHFAHHRFTQVPGRDPELAIAKPESWVEYLYYLSGIAVWISHARTLFNNASGRHNYAFVPEKRRKKVTKEARIYLLCYAILLSLSIWLSTLVLLYIWILPLVIGQPFLRIYLLAEHGRCVFVANMFENTRTTYTNKIVRSLAWNMPFHAEHHSCPSVPFHNLPELHKLMEPHLKEVSYGYTAFNRTYMRDLSK